MFCHIGLSSNSPSPGTFWKKEHLNSGILKNICSQSGVCGPTRRFKLRSSSLSNSSAHSTTAVMSRVTPPLDVLNAARRSCILRPSLSSASNFGSPSGGLAYAAEMTRLPCCASDISTKDMVCKVWSLGERESIRVRRV